MVCLLLVWVDHRFGFDLDYTLALYNSTFDRLTYSLLVKGLIGMGYPAELQDLPYDDSFIVRGLLVDKRRGNFIQMDRSANVLVCIWQ
jgi:hypothetical protein